MEIYIEDVLISNTLLNIMILKNIAKLFNEKQNKILLFLASLLGGVIALISPKLMLGSFIDFMFKVLTLFFIVKLCFFKSSFKKILQFFLLFAVSSYIISGFLLFLGVNSVNSIYLILPFYCITILSFGIYDILNKKISKNQFVFKTEFEHNSIKISSLAFLDTGNNLMYNGKSLMIVNLSFILKFYPDFKSGNTFKMPFEIVDSIIVKTVGAEGRIYITKIDKIVIYTNDKQHIFNDILVGINISGFENFDMLFSLQNLC